ncbi:MAG: hypothetical protein WCU88_09460 [Elusimicrobiota bacterium]|jgi:hypothetical protein
MSSRDCPSCADAEAEPASVWERGARIALALGIFALWLRFFRSEAYFSPVDFVNLAFHEAGHVIFGFLGTFIMVCGGTLMQLLLPAACLVECLRRDSLFGAQLCLCWIGENIINISIYMADARRQALPLIGGGMHDWTYLFEVMGVLPKNEGIAKGVFVLGSLVMLAAAGAIAAGGWTARRQTRSC